MRELQRVKKEQQRRSDMRSKQNGIEYVEDSVSEDGIQFKQKENCVVGNSCQMIAMRSDAIIVLDVGYKEYLCIHL